MKAYLATVPTLYVRLTRHHNYDVHINPAMVFLMGFLDFRCLQEVHLDKHIKLLDCPGIVMATSTTDAAMILRNCVKIEQLVDPLPPVEAILRRCNKAQVGHATSLATVLSTE